MKRWIIGFAVLGVCGHVGQVVASVVNGGFETVEDIEAWGEPQTDFGDWRGNWSEIVGPQQGIVPLGGTHMLRFLGTLPESNPGGGASSSDVGQQIDLGIYRTQIDAGLVTVHAAAYFNRVHIDDSTDTKFGLLIRAFDGPTFGTLGDERIAESAAFLLSDSDLSTWELVATSLLLPKNTDRIAVMPIAYENKHNDGSTLEFAGHYVDEVSTSITAIPEPSTLVMWFVLTAVGISVGWRRKRKSTIPNE